MNSDMKNISLRNIILFLVIMLLTVRCNKNDVTDAGNSVTDIDGNVYKTVQIGSQVWMAENLRATRYDNGSAIITGLNSDEWALASVGAYAVHGSDKIYGNFYNWFAVKASNLCPAGWRIPSLVEWETLIAELGGKDLAGGLLKSTSLLWRSPNTGATNRSGFNALPAGWFYGVSTWNSGTECTFWTSTSQSDLSAYSIGLNNDFEYVINSYAFKTRGHSCRCIKY
jgi:uncharacterized protein (TIGR02145 family)